MFFSIPYIKSNICQTSSMTKEQIFWRPPSALPPQTNSWHSPEEYSCRCHQTLTGCRWLPWWPPQLGVMFPWRWPASRVSGGRTKGKEEAKYAAAAKLRRKCNIYPQDGDIHVDKQHISKWLSHMTMKVRANFKSQIWINTDVGQHLELYLRVRRKHLLLHITDPTWDPPGTFIHLLGRYGFLGPMLVLIWGSKRFQIQIYRYITWQWFLEGAVIRDDKEIQLRHDLYFTD